MTLRKMSPSSLAAAAKWSTEERIDPARRLDGQRDAGTGIMRCPDGHSCDNFSVCVENPRDEGSYYCDCDAASPGAGDPRYAGLKCEHEATTYCLHSPWHGQTSESFCTNRGVCKQLVATSDGPHYGCDCPDGYVGDFCQFIEGSVPSNWPGSSTSGYNSLYAAQEKKESGAIAAIVIAVLAVIGAAAYFAYQKKQRHDVALEITKELGSEEAAMSSPTKSDGLGALELEADGGVLQEAVKESIQAAGGNDRMDNEDGPLEEAEII